jgi:uncharacterized protein YeaO (DUF488 family)
MDLRLKRVYEPATATDGFRVLIDRLWPRGVSKEQWFGHEPRRFAEFRRRYFDELRRQRPRLAELRRRARDEPVTLVYAARDDEHNDAVVLAEALRRGLPRPAAK